MMYEKVLVALDGSELAETILPFVAEFATSLELPVSLLHAVDPDYIDVLADPERGHHRDKVEEDLKARSGSYLTGVAESLPKSISGECHVHVGRAADVIAEYAGREEKTLIAMATHGHSGLKRMWLGSVAGKVLQVCANPMLLIRAGDEPVRKTTLSRMIVPLDGSVMAEQILKHVVYIARALPLEVALFRVHTLAPNMYAIAGYPSLEVERTAREKIKRESELYLNEKADALRAQGIRDVDAVAVEGDAAAEITDMARKTKNNMVAMSTHGRSGVARWLLGSVTDKVVRQSGDVVLVVRS